MANIGVRSFARSRVRGEATGSITDHDPDRGQHGHEQRGGNEAGDPAPSLLSCRVLQGQCGPPAGWCPTSSHCGASSQESPPESALALVALDRREHRARPRARRQARRRAPTLRTGVDEPGARSRRRLRCGGASWLHTSVAPAYQTATSSPTRDDERVGDRISERDLYSQIVRRATRVRERAAETLRRSRAQDHREQDTVGKKRRRLRRKG